MNPRVLIIADDALARVGLATLLSNRPECVVVGQVARAADLAQAAQLYRPDVAVCDVGSNPAHLIERANWRELSFPVLALLPDASNAAGAWSAGARGLLWREASPETLVTAIGSLVQGLIVFDPAFAAAVPRAREPSAATPIEALTPRELQVLRLLADGQSNKEIARALGISEHTVKFHVNAILGKLNAASRTEAVVTATRLGWILL